MPFLRRTIFPLARRWSVVGCGLLYLSAFIVTHLPPARVPATGLLSDKLKHGIGFFVLGVSTYWTISAVRRPTRLFPVVLVAWAAMLCYAMMDEVTQPLVGRAFEWGDVMADAVGAIVGLLIAAALGAMTQVSRVDRTS